MARVLDMMWSAVLSTWALLRDWIVAFLEVPGSWVGPALAVAALLLLLLLVLMLLPGRRGEQKTEARPELLVSRGEVRLMADSNLTELVMHVSNLGESVAQLLEVALSSDLMPEPETVELSVLVPPSRSVDVQLQVDELDGDTGRLDLYFYTPQARNRAYRLRAELVWEPWKGRYKVDPLGQRIEPVRRLASSTLQKRQRQEWRRRRQEVTVAPGLADEDPVERGDTQAADERSQERERERERLDFPSDF